MTAALPEPYDFTGTEAEATPGLITLAELATICREPGDVIPEAKLSLANMIIDLASDLIRDEAKHEEWVAVGDPSAVPPTVSVPFKAKLICLLVAKRSYENPRMIKQEGGVGPIGGDTFADLQTMGLYLTDAEKTELQKLRGTAGSGDPNGMWILSNTGGNPPVPTGFVFDDSGSDWAIPYVDFASTDAMTTAADTVT